LFEGFHQLGHQLAAQSIQLLGTVQGQLGDEIALLDQDLVARAITKLGEDLKRGAWHDRHHALLDEVELDLGYRLVIVHSP